MLAAMNGHTAAVKLLLDMGSDINAQIETNRNTALTLACFQGRHDVVSLLVDRKANIGEKINHISFCFTSRHEQTSSYVPMQSVVQLTLEIGCESRIDRYWMT